MCSVASAARALRNVPSFQFNIRLPFLHARANMMPVVISSTTSSTSLLAVIISFHSSNDSEPLLPANPMKADLVGSEPSQDLYPYGTSTSLIASFFFFPGVPPIISTFARRSLNSSMSRPEPSGLSANASRQIVAASPAVVLRSAPISARPNFTSSTSRVSALVRVEADEHLPGGLGGGEDPHRAA